MTRETPVPLRFGDEELEGVLVARRDSARRPGVVIFPTVMGVSDLELGFARQLVHLGYTGFVADLFGKRFRGAPRETMSGELKRLRSDRARRRTLRRRRPASWSCTFSGALRRRRWSSSRRARSSKWEPTGATSCAVSRRARSRSARGIRACR